jgi:hypothetical protein
MKEVDVAVRAVAGLANSVLGRDVMELALSPRNGPLKDPGAEAGEQSVGWPRFSRDIT